MPLPIDREKALETVDGDEELFQELVNMLLGQASSRLSQLESALTIGDAKAVEHLAHSLRQLTSPLNRCGRQLGSWNNWPETVIWRLAKTN